MQNLFENSLYISPIDRAALVADKQKCADALMFNYFGFLGLFKLSDSRGTIKLYGQTEGKLWLKNIGDENHDVSLIVKLASEAGVITTNVANEMTKLLYLIKNKTITSDSLNEQNVRDILLKIPFRSHCTPSVVTVLHHFESGSISLFLLAKELFDLCKSTTIFKPITAEFKQYVIKGNYIPYFNKLNAGLHKSQKGITNPVTGISSLNSPNQSTSATNTSVSQTTSVAAPTAPPATATTAVPHVHPTPTASVTAKPVVVTPVQLKPVDASFYRTVLSIGFSDSISDDDKEKKLKDAFQGYDRTTYKAVEFRRWMSGLSVRDLKMYGTGFKSTPSALEFRQNVLFRYMLSELSIDLREVSIFQYAWTELSILDAITDFKKLHNLSMYLNKAVRINVVNSQMLLVNKIRDLVIKEILERLKVAGSNRDAISCRNDMRVVLTRSDRIALEYDVGSRTNPIGIIWNEHVLTTEQVMVWLSLNLPDSSSLSNVESGTSLLNVGSGSLAVVVQFGQYSDAFDTKIKKDYGLTDLEIGTVFNDNMGFLKGSMSKVFITEKGLEKLPVGMQEVFRLYKDSAVKVIKDVDTSDSKAMFITAIVPYFSNYNVSIPSINDANSKLYSELLQKALRDRHTIEEISKELNTPAMITDRVLYSVVSSGALNMRISSYMDSTPSIDVSMIELFMVMAADRYINSTSFARLDTPLSFVSNMIRLADKLNKFSDYSARTIKVALSGIYEKHYKSSLLRLFNNELTQKMMDYTEWEKYVPEAIYPISKKFPNFRKNIDLNLAQFSEIVASGFSHSSDERIECLAACLKDTNMKFLTRDVIGTSATGYFSSAISYYLYMCIYDKELQEAFLKLVTEDDGPTKAFKNFVTYNMKSIASLDGLVETLFRLKPEFLRKIAEITDAKTGNLGLLMLTLTDSEKDNLVTTDGLPSLADPKKMNHDTYNSVVTELFRATIEKPGKSALLLEKMYRDFRDPDAKISAPIKRAITAEISKHVRAIHDLNPHAADEAFKASKGEFRKKLVEDAQGEDFFRVIRDSITDPKNPIVPMVPLDDARIEAMLKYNNVQIPALADFAASIPRSKLNLSMIMSLSKDFARKQAEMKVVNAYKGLSEQDEKLVLEKKSVEYDKFNKYRHGRTAGVRFLKEFNVYLKDQHDAWALWAANHPNARLMKPVFHGTGSIAASMILRYGFTVISSSDPSTAGRMLGDGIYFSTVTDKVVQYMSDSGFVSTRIGIKGYVFEMQAQVDVKGYPKCKQHPNSTADYDWCDAGESKRLLSGNIRTMVSEEGAVYFPKGQLIINKAYETLTVPKEEIEELKKKHPQGINAGEKMRITTFTQFLNEAKTEGYSTSTTYVFIDGYIPTPTGYVYWADPVFSKVEDTFLPNVRLEPTAIGPMIVVDTNDPEPLAYCIDNTAMFVANQPKDRDEFLSVVYGK